MNGCRAKSGEKDGSRAMMKREEGKEKGGMERVGKGRGEQQAESEELCSKEGKGEEMCSLRVSGWLVQLNQATVEDMNELVERSGPPTCDRLRVLVTMVLLHSLLTCTLSTLRRARLITPSETIRPH